MNKKSLTPFVATHPGEMIKDELKDRGMTQKQLAEVAGIKPSVLSETINGKRSVSLKVAVALEKTLGIPADIWMNLQAQYDLDTANITERDRIVQEWQQTFRRNRKTRNEIQSSPTLVNTCFGRMLISRCFVLR